MARKYNIDEGTEVFKHTLKKEEKNVLCNKLLKLQQNNANIQEEKGIFQLYLRGKQQ